MAGNYPDGVSIGGYIQTTINVDVQKIDSVDVQSKAFKELLTRLYNDVNKIMLATNDKLIGYYPLTENMSGGKYFPTTTNSASNAINFRQEFVKVINFGPLPNIGSKPIAHGITFDANTTFTQIYATATSPTTLEALPIPYVYPGAAHVDDAIALSVGPADVTITTAEDYSRFTRCIVVLKYLKTL